MKKSKLNESQIVAMLNEGEAGIPVAELCRKYQISNATYYKLKVKYTGMNTTDIKRMKTLEEENRRLKQMYADLSLDHQILKDVMEKKFPGLIDDN
jgi:putative transposase